MRDPAAGPELDAFIADQVGWAAERDPGARTHAYGDDPEQVGDLRTPAGLGPHPVVVILHGGAYRARFVRQDMNGNAVDLVRRGYASWNVEYRRTGSGGGAHPTTADVSAALARLATLPAPLDLDRVVLLGHSAGGQLALWAAHLPEVSRVVALAPVCDLAALATGPDTPYARFVGGLPADLPEDFAYLDPTRWFPTGAEQVVLCGLDDRPDRLRQNRDFVERARTAGERARLQEVPDAGHFTFMDPRSTAWAAVRAVLADLLPAD
jgi:acetyl esterase/lipase